MAYKNRKVPSFMVEIPQGEQFFDSSSKKHFQRAGYHSTIGEDKIMTGNELLSTPSRDRGYFRSLNIDDIEGATPNTLISKAVKNRLKAQGQLAQRDKQRKEEEAHQQMI
jgi:hypothetical protein